MDHAIRHRLYTAMAVLCVKSVCTLAPISVVEQLSTKNVSDNVVIPGFVYHVIYVGLYSQLRTFIGLSRL